MLPDGSVLSYDVFSSIAEGKGHAQRYLPSTGTWVDAGSVPVALSSPAVGYELGGGSSCPMAGCSRSAPTTIPPITRPRPTVGPPGRRSPAVSRPTTRPWPNCPTASCSWRSTRPCSKARRITSNSHTATNTFTEITTNFPSGYLGGPAYVQRQLILPSGQVLMGNGGNDLMVYTPDSGPLLANIPKIKSIVENANGSFLLTGTGINGNNAGASYGDDVEMDTNFPIVSFTDSKGIVSFARTYGGPAPSPRGRPPRPRISPSPPAWPRAPTRSR